MAAPPPAYTSPRAGNPDTRSLPDGWITRWDDNYSAWYYVDTRARPPRSSWDHPLGPAPSSASGNFSPTPTSPPTRGYVGGQPFPQQQGSYSGPPYNQNPSYPGPGYQGNTQEQRGYPQQPGYPSTNYGGGPPGNYGNNTSWPQQQSWQQAQPGYQTQPPSQAIQQPPRSGRNNALLAGVGGLALGAVGMEVFEHHEERERDEAYDQGLDQGYNQGFDNGQQDPDFGGDQW